MLRTLTDVRDLPGLMAALRANAREYVGADGITFVLRDKGFCYYADEDAISPLWKGQRFPLHECISGWVMENKAAAVIPDVFADHRVPADVYRRTFVKSLAMVPVGGGQTVAAIGAYWANPHTASDNEVHRLEVLARGAAVVLEQTCPECSHRGLVRVEHIFTRGTASRHFYCGACEHVWISR